MRDLSFLVERDCLHFLLRLYCHCPLSSGTVLLKLPSCYAGGTAQDFTPSFWLRCDTAGWMEHAMRGVCSSDPEPQATCAPNQAHKNRGKITAKILICTVKKAPIKGCLKRVNCAEAEGVHDVRGSIQPF